MALQVVILAAGQGKRMCSSYPKMLHCLGGKPLLEHVIQTALSITAETKPIIVYGHQGARLRDAFSGYALHWVEQTQQLGTGHALRQALPEIASGDHVLVLSGDVPLITSETLQRLIQATATNGVGLLTARVADATGYGRIKRGKNGKVCHIVEEKDATDAERAITEINPGVYLMPASLLAKWLPTLTNQNAQGEYYLPDLITCAVEENIAVDDIMPFCLEEIAGVNDRIQLAALERCYQHRQAKALMRQGVTVMDPARLDIRGEARIAADTILDVNVVLEGQVVIGRDCVIGPNVYLRNTKLGDRVEVKANSVLDGAEVGADSVIGPFARLRPGTVLANQVHIGNFVEIKNSVVRNASKINHLSYVGDSDIGQQVNVGAGTITCNYDGANKHKTHIGDHVHIGSGTQLVAPVTVGEGATLGAGSVLVKDAPAHQLTLTHRLEQRSSSAWVRPKRDEKVEN